MIIAGLDSGRSGALAVRNDEGLVYSARFSPAQYGISAIDLANQINDHRVDVAYIEKATSMPKQGVSSTFKFGTCYGITIGVIQALAVPMYIISAKDWKSTMLRGTKRTKDDAIDVAKLLYPEYARVIGRNHNIAEAILIAEHGWLMQRGENAV